VSGHTRGGKHINPYPRGAGSSKQRKSKKVVVGAPDKVFVETEIRKILRDTFPASSEVIFFGGFVDKPWPRKDVDVLVVIKNTSWFEELPEQSYSDWVSGSIEDIIDRTNNKIDLATKISGDVFVYIDSYGDMYHEDGMEGIVDVGLHSPLLFNEVLMKTARQRGKVWNYE